MARFVKHSFGCVSGRSCVCVNLGSPSARSLYGIGLKKVQAVSNHLNASA